jgi:anti-sigma factor RsiW
MIYPRDRRRAIVCIHFVELVTDYLEGMLPGDVRRRIEEHLAGCDGCDAYLEQMRLIRRTVGSIDLQRVPEEMLKRLVAAFRVPS